MDWSKCANCGKHWPKERMELGELDNNPRVADPNKQVIAICPKCIKEQDSDCENLGIEKTSHKIKEHAKK